MSTTSELRKAIKAQFPNLQFKIRTVDFTDLARDSKVFVESPERVMQRVIRSNTPYNQALLQKRFGKQGQESIVCPFCQNSFWDKVDDHTITCHYCESVSHVAPEGDHWRFTPIQ